MGGSSAKELNMRRVWAVSIAGWVAIATATTAIDYFLAQFQAHYGEAKAITLWEALRVPIVEYTYWAVTTPAILYFTRGFRLSSKMLSRTLLVFAGWFLLFWFLHACYRAASNHLLYPSPRGVGYVPVV